MFDRLKIKLEELFGYYQSDIKAFPWENLNNAKEWEQDNPDKLAMLDAISGLINWQLGNKAKAKRDWCGVIKSERATNASKVIAHAGMATLYTCKKDSVGAGLALDELCAIGGSYDVSPWTIEALNVMVEVFEDRCTFNEKANKAIELLISEYQSFNDSPDEAVRQGAELLRANCHFFIASELVTDEERHRAEKMLTRLILPAFERAGASLRLADAKNLLCLIDWLDGDLGYAAVELEAAWATYVKADPLSEKTLHASRALLDLYDEQDLDEPETRLLALLVQNDFENPQGFLEMLNEWIGQDQGALTDATAKSLSEP